MGKSPSLLADIALTPMPDSVKEMFSCQIASAPLQPLWALLSRLRARNWVAVAAVFLEPFYLSSLFLRFSRNICET